MDPVTGDAPQPGETPRTEGNPWSFDPDAAWWRGEGDREHAEALAEAAARPRNPRRRGTGPARPSGTDEDEPAFAEEALDAHAAGVQDAAEALDAGAGAPPEVEADTVEQVQAEEPPVAVERDHDQPTQSRYQPPEPEPEAEERPDLADRPDGVPEIMVLPEPDRNRPTVALERSAVPGQPSAPVRRPDRPDRPDRLGQRRMSAAELNVKRSRMENSPFWLNDEERAAAGNAWPAPELHGRRAAGTIDERRGRPSRHRTPRNAAPGLFGLIALALIAAFFSWVSVEPFWLAVGHGYSGLASVARCSGSGVTQRCAGSFTAADGSFTAGEVTLFGVPKASAHPGSVTPAQMVNPTSRQAYASGSRPLLLLRWVLGFLLVLICGLGIAGLTGTRQLETVRARRAALLMSVAGPVVLLTGFLLGTY